MVSRVKVFGSTKNDPFLCRRKIQPVGPAEALQAKEHGVGVVNED
jgi:hypothetical protein